MIKTFSIKTLGCKLNQYESSLIAGQFIGNGWTAKPFGENVDIVIINTCTVTNKSDKKCRNYIRQGAGFSKTAKVLVTGCLAERDADYLKTIPEIFAVVKNADKEKIFFIAKDYNDTFFFRQGENPYSDNRQYHNKSNEKDGYPLPFYRTRGLIKIQDGCDGKCSYCIVPIVRGASVSRDFTEIMSHAKKLIDTGCPELILTGITIGRYNSNNKKIADLIKEIIDLKGEFRVRITSIEPNHVSEDLIDCFSNNKLCSHIHIPLQSGSDMVLKSMRRPYSIKDYMNVIYKIKKINNDISIGTDIIIGFPGESEEDYRLSLKIVDEVQFSYVHQFTFSPRSGTQAFRMPGCSHETVIDRSLRMRDLSAGIGLNYRKKFLGRYLSSVIEKNKTKNGYRAVSGNYIKMDIKDSLLDTRKVGKISNVRLEKAGIDRNVGVMQ